MKRVKRDLRDDEGIVLVICVLVVFSVCVWLICE